MFTPIDPLSQVRWLPVKNTDATTAPSFAALELTGWDATDEIWTVRQPSASGLSPSVVLVNGPMEIPSGMEGSATRDFPIMAAMDDSGGPGSVGDALGTVASDWRLAPGQTGFFLWKPADTGLAVVVQAGGGGGGPFVSVLFDFVAMNTAPYKTHVATGACYYSGKKFAGYVAATDTATYTTAVWVRLIYNPTIFNYDMLTGVGWTPASAVYLNGKSSMDCWDSGDSLNVTTAGGPQGTRPVFLCNNVAAAWADSCSGTGPATINLAVP